MGVKVTPRQIGPSQLKRWHAKRRTEVTESTAFGNLMSIQRFSHWAKDERLCSSKPVLPLTTGMSKTRIPPAPAARKDFCTPDLRNRLIAEAPGQDLGFVLHCGFHTGLRFNEIVEARAF